MAEAWRLAFEAIQRENNFSELQCLLDSLKEGSTDLEVNASLEWDGAFLTPLFAAVLLRLDDHLPQLLAVRADPSSLCLFEGCLCSPLHAASFRGDSATVRLLVDLGCDAGVLGETSALTGDDSAHGTRFCATGESDVRRGFTGCNALHLLLLRDLYSKEVFQLLITRGVRLSAACRTPDGSPVLGLELPRRFGNIHATEEQLDQVIGDEVKHMIRAPEAAENLNQLLEAGAALRRRPGGTALRFAKDVDFSLHDGTDRAPAAAAACAETALLYAAELGNSAAVRLLLYGGADASRVVAKSIDFGGNRTLTLQAQTIHVAALRADTSMLEQLIFFGIPQNSSCSGTLSDCLGEGEIEDWTDVGLVHLAVLARAPRAVPEMLRLECDINAKAFRTTPSSNREAVTPLCLAAILGDPLCAASLLDSGVIVDDKARQVGLGNEALREMFGGASTVGIEDWFAALLTGEPALQRLLDKRTNLARAVDWPEGSTAELLERHRLAGPELVARLSKALGEVPTTLRGVLPVHLACLFQQPWALEMLADAGALVAEAPACREMPSGAAELPPGHPELADGVPMDALFLCARVGGLHMAELLHRDPRFKMDVEREVPLVPDLTPPYYPRCHSAGDDLSPTWAWRRLAPLELALLHRRADMAVLLVRLGANLLHTVDHVAVHPPSHYSITDACFRDLTPLHICALLDNTVVAAALIGEACGDEIPVVPGEHSRPQRQALLSAVCVQAWATVDTVPGTDSEPWLWRDLTPLHLAMVTKSYGVAELLIEASTPQTLGIHCLSRDMSSDVERSFSPLLLAYEYGLKDLHRKIAKKFPVC